MAGGQRNLLVRGGNRCSSQLLPEFDGALPPNVFQPRDWNFLPDEFSSARDSHSMVQLPNSNIPAAGGLSAGDGMESEEFYNPISDT